MGLFSNPESVLKRKLEAGWIAVGVAKLSPLGPEAAYERIVNDIYRAAQPLAVKGKKDVALGHINAARRPDDNSSDAAIWHQMLDTVIRHL